MSREMINRFERLNNVKITLRYFKTEIYRNYVLSTSRSQRYDLVLVDNHSLYTLKQHGQLRDLSKLRELIGHRFDPESLAACGDYGIPYTWGTVGIYYRSSLQAEPIESWSQLLNVPPAHQGGVLMNENPLEGISIALMAAGRDPFSADMDDLKAAYKLLEQQKPNLLDFGILSSYLSENTDSSQLSMAVGYSGSDEKILARTGHNDWQYVVPKEGTLKWTECLAIPKDALYGEIAQSYIEFINEADNAAKNAEELWIPTPNLHAKQLTSELYQSDPNLYPSAEELERVYPYQKLTASQLRTRGRMMFSLR